MRQSTVRTRVKDLMLYPNDREVWRIDAILESDWREADPKHCELIDFHYEQIEVKVYSYDHNGELNDEPMGELFFAYDDGPDFPTWLYTALIRHAEAIELDWAANDVDLQEPEPESEH